MKKTYIKPATEVIEMQAESALLKLSGDSLNMIGSDDDGDFSEDNIL